MLLKEQYIFDIRKHSLSKRTINAWNNKLSTGCIKANSVNKFKTKIDKCLNR